MTQMEIERRQEEIEELTEKVETAKKDQKELFLIVFQVSIWVDQIIGPIVVFFSLVVI